MFWSGAIQVLRISFYWKFNPPTPHPFIMLKTLNRTPSQCFFRDILWYPHCITYHLNGLYGAIRGYRAVFTGNLTPPPSWPYIFVILGRCNTWIALSMHCWFVLRKILVWCAASHAYCLFMARLYVIFDMSSQTAQCNDCPEHFCSQKIQCHFCVIVLDGLVIEIRSWKCTELNYTECTEWPVATKT